MRRYDTDFKRDAIRLASEIGQSKASRELGIPINTINIWMSKFKKGEKFGSGEVIFSEESMTKEVLRLKRELKEKDETIKILQEATAFFARSQKK